MTQEIEQEIAELEARLSDLKKRLPAHSIPPAMIAELDELDEQLAEARLRLAASQNRSRPQTGESSPKTGKEENHAGRTGSGQK